MCPTNSEKHKKLMTLHPEYDITIYVLKNLEEINAPLLAN
jgi:hypothetical protein